MTRRLAPALVTIAFTIAFGAMALAKPATKPPSKGLVPKGIINDSWYTMQAGSTPYGYFHEIIEEKEGKYSYRYALTKVERGKVYEENIGALADANLKMVALNLNKTGSGALETVNATYSEEANNGVFTITVEGARKETYKRHTQKDIILDVFFPVWLRQRPELLNPGQKGRVMTLAEDPDRNTFMPRSVRFEAVGVDAEENCVKLRVLIDNRTSADWCMTREGVLVSLKVASYRVKRVATEGQAKAFLAGFIPKK